MTPIEVRYTEVNVYREQEPTVTTCFLHAWSRDESGYPCGILEFPDGRLKSARLHTIKIVNPLVPMAG